MLIDQVFLIAAFDSSLSKIGGVEQYCSITMSSGRARVERSRKSTTAFFIETCCLGSVPN